jgi:hypothetical protein
MSAFSFRFSPTGTLLELSHSSAPIVIDEPSLYSSGVEHGLHGSSDGSSTAYKPSGWAVSLPAGKWANASYSSIASSLVSSNSTHATITHESGALHVADDITFGAAGQIEWSFTVTNKLNVPVTASIPVVLGGLRLGNIGPHGVDPHDTGLHRIQADKGGNLQQPFNVSGAYIKYPTSIGAFSPMSLLGDAQRSIALVWTTDLELPVNISMYEMPRGAFTPSMTHVLGTPLGPAESQAFSLLISLGSGSGVDANWRAAVGPYKRLLSARYGDAPAYCPAAPMAYLVGSNARFENGSSFVFDHQNGRYLPGVRYREDVFRSTTAPPRMHAAGVGRYGVWHTALNSSYITRPSCPKSCCFNPDIDLLDPNLDAARNLSIVAQFAAEVRQAGVTPFHFARPCAEITGANVTYDGGAAKFTPGDFSRAIDLRDPAVASRAMARLAFFVDRGFGGFYLDAMSCPGDTAFLKAVVKRWPHVFLMKEGARDRDAYLWSQMPILKLPHYPQNNSVLIQELRPLASMYIGAFDNPLAEDEFDAQLAKGASFIGVVANSPAAFLGPTIRPDVCKHTRASLQNQASLNQAYGQALGCAAPLVPTTC